MLLNCDKFFIEELQKEGYDIDYKRLTTIYRQSRQNDRYKARQARKDWEASMMMKSEEEFLEALQKQSEPKKKRTKKSGG